ncbi:MAG TPA: glycosyltransferase family 39 protein [Candidatus Acidoferrales bacterium]|jgi:4-amino-4-deoxy-L-arabinose transferase-like glycosyltransferase|nr:glycosyltransferase family 39 protein [Candidatus Acidoferrales bacterium]
MNRRFAILILLALSAGIYAGTAGWPALLDSSDAAHAEAAREMAQSGDWTILHINGIRYLEKPPLHYWLVAASYKLFGVSAFSTRLPLALAVVGLVLMVYVFARTWFGEKAGFYAGLVMCTAPGTFLFTRIMIPEAIYALEFTGIFYLFLRGWTGTLPRRAAYWGVAALMALAFLTRSLVGVVFPAGILFLFLVATGGWRRWRELPFLSGGLIFLAIAAPWHIAAGLRAPGFFWFYFLNEQVLRALGMRYPHDYEAVPLLIWWASHVIWFFPWVIFAPYALREFPRPRTWRQLDASGQARLLVFAWAGFILLFFSWTASRMEYYSFSGWPAIAILLGLGLERAEERRAAWLPRLQGGLAAVGVLIAAGLGGLLWISRGIQSTDDITKLLQTNPAGFYRVAMADFFDLTPQSFANLRQQGVVTILVLLLGLGGAWLLRRRRHALASSLTTAMAVACFLLCANWALGVFEPHLSSRPLAAEVEKYLQPGDQLALYGEYDAGSSFGFYTQQRLWIVNGRYNGLEFGSNYPDAPKIFLSDATFPGFWRGPRRVFLLVPPQQDREALARLPEDSTYFLAAVGGKTLYTNQPVKPDQPSLSELRERGGGAKPAVPAASTGDAAPPALQGSS